METIKTTKTVTKTIETVTTITTVEVIRETKVITVEEPIEVGDLQEVQEEPQILEPKLKIKETLEHSPLVQDAPTVSTEPVKRISKPDHLWFKPVTDAEEHEIVSEPVYIDEKLYKTNRHTKQVNTGVIHAILYWDTATKHRKVKGDYIGKQIKYNTPESYMPHTLLIDKDLWKSMLFREHGNYQLKPEFKARLEQYLGNGAYSQAKGNHGIVYHSPYVLVADQDYKFFHGLGLTRKLQPEYVNKSK